MSDICRIHLHALVRNMFKEFSGSELALLYILLFNEMISNHMLFLSMILSDLIKHSICPIDDKPREPYVLVVEYIDWDLD